MKSLKNLHSDCERIWRAALKAVDPEAAVRRYVRRKGQFLYVGERKFDLDAMSGVWVLGAGKAAAPMGRSLEKILGKYLSGGFLVSKYGHGPAPRKLEFMEAGHPYPDENSVLAAKRFESAARDRIVAGDLVFCLLSGGASSLLVSPLPGISLEDKMVSTRALMRAGASIRELNAIRKHLSALKGGRLVRMVKSSTIVSLILSDVVGDDPATIASGPTVPDVTTFGDCMQILERYRLTKKLPQNVIKLFREGMAGRVEETPKRFVRGARESLLLLVGNNTRACTSAMNTARRLGYHSTVLTSLLEGDTRSAARFHMSVLDEVVAENRPLPRPACIISGGETTVSVTGKGRGGRNQEFVMHCVRPLADMRVPCLVASLGTDGSDGPTEAAGATADNSSLTRSLKYGSSFLQDAIENNDSYEFFKRIGGLIVTGPTRTNVMDLRILLVG